jgi:hypothetical protein
MVYRPVRLDDQILISLFDCYILFSLTHIPHEQGDPAQSQSHVSVGQNV